MKETQSSTQTNTPAKASQKFSLSNSMTASKEALYYQMPGHLSTPVWYERMVASDKCKKNPKYYQDNYKDMFNENDRTKVSTVTKLEETWKKFDKPDSRKLKPLSIEYIHLKRYKNKIDNPFNKQTFFDKEYRNDEKQVGMLETHIKDTVNNLSLQASKLKNLKTSNLDYNKLQFIPTEEFNKIKTRKDFDESLKVQKQQLST